MLLQHQAKKGIHVRTATHKTLTNPHFYQSALPVQTMSSLRVTALFPSRTTQAALLQLAQDVQLKEL